MSPFGFLRWINTTSGGLTPKVRISGYRVEREKGFLIGVARIHLPHDKSRQSAQPLLNAAACGCIVAGLRLSSR